ncbi:MAG: acetate--CoA ligase family protein [Deltaproteobacteria bacterium]|nr:acetate--CoA ligase family protein [Deltaproteobacteria bacterium]
MEHSRYPDLAPLFEPKSIAIIGASNDIAKPAGLPLHFVLKHKFRGKVFPVNPARAEVQGLKCYPSVLDIPEEVDAALLVVPAPEVPELLRQCARKVVKAAVVPVSGFAENGPEGKKRQDEIDEILRESGLRMCGPNTNGLLNVHGNVSLGYSYAQEVVTAGSLAYITQSGALLSASAPRLTQRGIGFSYFIASGNQADLDTFDYARYVLDDPHTHVLALYVEGFKDPDKFLEVADLALERGKPLVIIKVGRSEVAARAALGHTGSLVGSDAVFDAVCRQKGVIRVDDFDHLIAALLAFLKCPLPRGNRVGMVSTSGGAMSLVADHAIGRDLRFPDLSARTKEQAARIIPAYGEMQNPFDIGAAGASATRDAALCESAVRLLVGDENIDIVLAALTPIDPRGTLNFLSAVVEVSKTTDKPVILFCPMAGLREAEEAVFADCKVPMLFDSAECVTAISSLVRFAETRRRVSEAPPYSASTGETQIDPRAKEAVEALALGRSTLTEHESKELLARYGIQTVPEEVAATPDEAAAIAERLGYPVALKVNSSAIVHKSDAGAVRLDVANEGDLRTAYSEVIANSKRYDPEAEVRGVLVQRMRKEGVEVYIGMSRDPQFGPTIAFGLGGVLVEVLRDVSLRVAPISRSDAEEMVREVRGYRLLEGFRGKPKADVAGLIETLLKVSRLSIEMGSRVAEIDINPLLVFAEGRGVEAIDALVVLQST